LNKEVDITLSHLPLKVALI